tara:strand:- start:104 stop:1114 length:1011 start_codon:yes stop_codon:yes gene_type:complete
MKKLKTIFKKNIVTTKTPLRISFSGGGTDMPYFYSKFNGITVSTSINKFVYVTVKRHSNFEEKFRLNYSETEIVKSIDNIKNLRIRETLKYFKIDEPLYINTISDLPYNTGLGSSSAFLIGLINGIFLLQNKNVKLKTLSEIAFKIENKITKNSLGKQDHYIAAYGGLKYITYLKKNITVNKIMISKKNLEFLNRNLLFLWTGKTRLSKNNLIQQKKNLNNNINDLQNLKKIAIKFKNLLISKKLDLNMLGFLLNQNWKIKKNFTKTVSNIYLNKIYNDAISAGCLGGKLLGAGGGGFFLFICKKNIQKKVISKIKNCTAISIKFHEKGSKNCFVG